MITNELYLKRYPQIATMMDEGATNSLWRNVFYKCGRDVSGNRATLDMLANGVFENDPGLTEKFAIKSGAAILNSIGFRPIPVDEIGLYQDQWRVK